MKGVVNMLGKIISGASSLGASMVIGMAAKAVTPENIKKCDKLLIGLGVAGIGGLVGSKVGEYVEGQVNEIKELFKTAKEEKEDE